MIFGKSENLEIYRSDPNILTYIFRNLDELTSGSQLFDKGNFAIKTTIYNPTSLILHIKRKYRDFYRSINTNA